MISTVELEIGGQQIDKHDCYWFRVYDELCRQESEKVAYLRCSLYNGHGNRRRPNFCLAATSFCF